MQGSGSDRLLVSGCKLRFVLLISKILFAFSILLTKSVANFCSSRMDMVQILMLRLREQEVVGIGEKLIEVSDYSDITLARKDGDRLCAHIVILVCEDYVQKSILAAL